MTWHESMIINACERTVFILIQLRFVSCFHPDDPNGPCPRPSKYIEMLMLVAGSSPNGPTSGYILVSYYCVTVCLFDSICLITNVCL